MMNTGGGGNWSWLRSLFGGGEGDSSKALLGALTQAGQSSGTGAQPLGTSPMEAGLGGGGGGITKLASGGIGGRGLSQGGDLRAAQAQLDRNFGALDYAKKTGGSPSDPGERIDPNAPGFWDNFQAAMQNGGIEAFADAIDELGTANQQNIRLGPSPHYFSGQTGYANNPGLTNLSELSAVFRRM